MFSLRPRNDRRPDLLIPTKCIGPRDDGGRLWLGYWIALPLRLSLRPSDGSVPPCATDGPPFRCSGASSHWPVWQWVGPVAGGTARRVPSPISALLALIPEGAGIVVRHPGHPASAQKEASGRQCHSTSACRRSTWRSVNAPRSGSRLGGDHCGRGAAGPTRHYPDHQRPGPSRLVDVDQGTEAGIVTMIGGERAVTYEPRVPFKDAANAAQSVTSCQAIGVH